ncbi:methyltransferase domain-containing protein [Thermococcus argininiproducens]|uniref:Methyltransferase domain-containing protein n=1 Tax=Thermococcus argininiproducens TaxID=2866384 RepID=A0A9E7SC61_9EURY|nr:methyltransferase domain-containing protein [Thermococcus argininiproducens]USG99529.1 methyltransferase domain-containing protein [Thermococcus argininiproducens]
MNFLKLYYDEALKVFYESGGCEEELYWLMSSILVKYPQHRDELKVRRKLMDLIVQDVKGKVLDVGCGVGILTFMMALKEEVEKAVGIDKGCEVISFCNCLRNKITEKAEFLCSDFLSVEINEGFNCVVFLYTLHDYEPEPFLEKALEALEEDGRIIVGDFDINGLREKIKAFVQENGLKIVKDTTIGRAKTHEGFYEAFLITARR